MAPTIDTLISTFTLFATVILGVFALIGGLLVWNGIALRQRAEKDLDKIEKLKDQTEEKVKSVQAIFNQAQSMITKLTEEAQGLRKIVTDAQNLAEQLDIKDKKFTALLSNLEYRANTYSNTLQGTANLFNSPAVSVAKSQPLSFGQPSIHLPLNNALHANPLAQTTNMLTQSVDLSRTTTTIDNGQGLVVTTEKKTLNFN